MTHTITTHCLPPSVPLSRPDKPLLLAIGGSDSAGLAGIQMDSRCAAALDVHCSTVISATTAQSQEAFIAQNPVSIDAFDCQLSTALSQEPQAIKIGMLTNAEQVSLLAQRLAQHLAKAPVPIVCDPVLAATSQANKATDSQFLSALQEQLLPLCTLVTPNFPEAQQLAGEALSQPWDLAHHLLPTDNAWVLLKGGHQTIDQNNQTQVVDYILGPQPPFSLAQPRLDTIHSRGTGCALASSIAALLAIGFEMRDALVIGSMIMHTGLLAATAINGKQGCFAPQGFPTQHWPHYSEPEADHWPKLTFPSCVGNKEPEELGLYPIFDSAEWLSRMLPHGVTTAQLRLKHLTGSELVAEIKAAVAIAKQHNCRLFINDYWQLAIDAGAYGVHLGQEDLQVADLTAISQAGLRLGISNHCHFELARALAINPSYLACGPIYATTTKQMPWVPYGLQGLHYWCQSLTQHPLVAIAGIDAGNITDIAATGVSGIALITAITKAKEPEQMAQSLQQLIRQHRPQGN